MKSKLIAAIGLTAVMMFTGCAGQSAGNAPAAEPAAETEAEPAAETETDQNTETEAEPAAETDTAAQPAIVKYESPQGWSVSYDSSLFEVTEDDGTNFTYKGEADGTNRIRVSYYQDKMPDEVLYEVMENADEMPEHTRSEDYFAGRKDVWSIRTSMASNTVPGAVEDFIAVERNGGTLLVQITTTQQADEMTGIGVSDALAAIVDSFELADQQPQTYSEYVPGKYTATVTDEIDGNEVSAEYFVQLNEDHTGVISMQDEVPIIWYSRDGIILNAETAEQIYEYNVEGDNLYLTDPAQSDSEESVTFEFTRETAEE